MSVSDIRVYAGAADGWVSIRGADGAPGPTVVSADAGNVAKLGTDGRISVQPADMDSRFVNVTGDTMTGPLSIQAPQAGATSILAVRAETGIALIDMVQAGDSAAGPRINLRNDRGTLAAPTAIQSGDSLGALRFVSTVAGNSDTLCGRFSSVALSAASATGVDTRLEMSSRCSDNTKPAASVFIDNTAATGRQFVVQCDNFSITPEGSVAANNKTGTSFRASGTGTGFEAIIAGVNATDTRYAVNVDLSGQGNYNAGVRISATNATAGKPAVGLQIVNTPNSLGNYSILSSSEAPVYFGGNVGIEWTNPTVPLEVGGAAIIRSTLNVFGNITSAGTAHSFAASSIPASAVAGLPTASAVAGAALAAAGVAGVSTAYARADHSHPFPTAANVGALPIGGGSLTGALSVTAAAFETITLRGDSTSGIRFQPTTGLRSEIYSGTDLSFFVDGAARLRISATGNLTSTGTAHTFAANSIPRAAVAGLDQASLDARYVNVTGDTMTGPLVINGNITSTGTAHTFAAGSIPSTAIKDLPITAQVITQAAYDALAVKSPTTLYLISG